MINERKKAYEALRKIVGKVGLGPGCHATLRELFAVGDRVLSESSPEDLVSKVAGKEYFRFRRDDLTSRSVTKAFFDIESAAAWEAVESILNGRRRDLDSETITRACYRVAMTFCASVDVTVKTDRRTQGAVFEWFCGALIQSALRVAPVRALEVLNLDLRGKLPTDFVFDLGKDRPKFHLPVKTSTRERVIQVWAHQRVLDGVYGVGRFLAMPIILAETKLDTRKLEVTEICLPWQWRLYQMHIALLWNVFYLDPPRDYLALDDKFPPVGVATIGDGLCVGGRLDRLLDEHGLAGE